MIMENDMDTIRTHFGHRLPMILAALALCLIMAAPQALARGMLPALAAEMADELDAQLARRLNAGERPLQGMSMMITTLAHLDNLESTTSLGRLMSEEFATWFASMGYRVQEIRKGRMLLFAPGKGEFLLTRRSNLLETENAEAALILAGTYSVTHKHVRFNVKLLHAASNEILAMCSGTAPLGPETRQLLMGTPGLNYTGIEPSVSTRLGPQNAY